MSDYFMNMSKYIFAIVIFMFSHLSTADTKVTFIVPDVKGPTFWKLVADTSLAAADDLRIDLKIIYSSTNRFALLETVNNIINQEIKPDYIVLRAITGNTQQIFSLLEQAKIKFITIEQSINRDQYEEFGAPRQYFKYWLGHIFYDDIAGGKLLRNALISAFKKRYPGKSIVLTGIGGDYTELSLNRQQSLVDLIDKEKINNVLFTQVFPVLWDPLILASRYSLIIKRYPDTNIFWAAGDQLALTLIEEQKRLNHKLLIIGGFDWLPDALNSIQKGELTASVGGHFLIAATAMLKIADYENGMDTLLLNSKALNYELITADNVNQYAKFINNPQWEYIDFKKFSNFYSGDDVKDLSLKNILSISTNKNLTN
jgi:ABC-type sugar transport system substrate-binding protein